MDKHQIRMLWSAYLPEDLRSLHGTGGPQGPFANPAGAMLCQSMDQVIDMIRGDRDNSLMTALDDLARIFLVHRHSMDDFEGFVRQGLIVIAASMKGSPSVDIDDIAYKARERAVHWQGVLAHIRDAGSFKQKPAMHRKARGSARTREEARS